MKIYLLQAAALVVPTFLGNALAASVGTPSLGTESPDLLKVRVAREDTVVGKGASSLRGIVLEKDTIWTMPKEDGILGVKTHIARNILDKVIKRQLEENDTLIGNDWGEILNCGANKGITGACSSGHEKNCNNNVDASWAKCSELNVRNTTSSPRWKTGSNGQGFVRCLPDEVAVSVCSSGTLEDCHLDDGRNVNFAMQCKMVEGAAFDERSSQEKCCEHGVECTCDEGTFVTAFCASGWDPECSCSGSSSSAHTGITCTMLTCKAGYEKKDNSTNFCSPCGKGNYSPEDDSKCLPCEEGTFNDEEAAQSCEPCEAGMTSGEGATTCNKCPQGTYKSGTGKGDCTECEPGEYQDQEGSTICKRCSSGESSSRGSSTCNKCPDGTSGNTCEDIDECKDETHECPMNSGCENIVKTFTSQGMGYKCACYPGFTMKGAAKSDDTTTIECEPLDLGMKVLQKSYLSLTIRSEIPVQLDKVDVHISRFITPSDTEPLALSPIPNVAYSNLASGYYIDSLDPGTKYDIQLMSPGTKANIVRFNATTSCECDIGGTDAPKSLSVVQVKGFILFEFTDHSRCEEGFSLFRKGPYFAETKESLLQPVGFTSTYYYSSDSVCKDAIEPGKQVSDELAISKLPVGNTFNYCVRAVGKGKSGDPYSSTEGCLKHKIAWQASINGIVKLAPEAGSLPVRDVKVSFELFANNATLNVSGSLVTDQSGKYYIDFSEYHDKLDSNADFEVRIWYYKKTLFEHRFLCDNGQVDCSNSTSYTRVFLKHLDFDVEHSAIDDSVVPIFGKVVIYGTGRSNDDFSVVPNTECPAIGAKVCLVIINGRDKEGATFCVEVDSVGNFGIGAAIGTLVRLEVKYFNHTFILDQEEYSDANDHDGFEISDSKKYENFIFKDVQKAPLLVNIVGGLCDRKIGQGEVIVSLPTCTHWKGMKLLQDGIKQEYNVLAQDVKVDVQIKGRPDITFDSQAIDLQPLQDESTRNELDEQEQSEQKMLRFQYDGEIVISVETSSNAAESCNENLPKEHSFHVLSAYAFFVATIKVEQDFGNDKIARCDHLPDETKVIIYSGVGLGNNPSDNNFIADMELDDEAIAGYTKCASQDKENDKCEYPSCCSLSIKHIEATDGTKSNAHVQDTFRAGPPFIASPYLKTMIVHVETTMHVVNALVVGDYDDGVPNRYPLPAMDPIMILRDPPGSSSYAYYENVKTTTRVQVKGVDRYMGFGLSTAIGAQYKYEKDLCKGAGVSDCDNVFEFEGSLIAHGSDETIVSTVHEVKTDEATFVTTWGYQTSGESDPAGHKSDIFVVPSISLLLHKVTEISFNETLCIGTAQQKVKFDVESKENENALSFLSLDGVNNMVEGIISTEQTLIRMIEDEETLPVDKEAASSILPQIQEASERWKDIISDYEIVNNFEKDANLLKPSRYFENEDEILPDGHWTSFIPAELKPKVEEEIGLEEWENVQLVSFSGGGSEFQYKLDKSMYDEFEYQTGEANDNSEYAYDAAISRSIGFTVFGIGISQDLGIGGSLAEVKTMFQHDISADDSSMGFVLSDADVGDHFDVKIAVDPTYKSFVFQTVGGISKCVHEEGTKQREKPNLSVKSKPIGEILPYNPAIFIIELANLGETSNDYVLSILNLDDIGGVGIFVNGANLASSIPYSGMDSLEARTSTISIHRGPILFEYPPIQLQFQSSCDGDASATVELYTHVRASDGAKVIRFAQECPKVVFVGLLGNGLVIINGAHDGILPIIAQNVERNFRGTLANMAADVDDTLEEVELIYRKVGQISWSSARVTRIITKNGIDTNETVDFDLVSSKEDDFGFVSDEWLVKELNDGEYEVMIRSKCPDAPAEFKEAKSQISILKLDRQAPKPFSFPSESEFYHAGSALRFEFNEELDCVRPFSFFVQVKVYNQKTKKFKEFNANNILTVCEERTISAQFDLSRVNLDDVDGMTFQFVMQKVRDVSGNIVVEDISSTVRFKDGVPGNTGNRRVQQAVDRADAGTTKSSIAFVSNELRLLRGDVDTAQAMSFKEIENTFQQQYQKFEIELLKLKFQNKELGKEFETDIRTLSMLFLIIVAFGFALLFLTIKRLSQK